MLFVAAVIDFDGTNWANGAFVAEDEIGGFIFDVAIGFGAALAADLVAEEGTEGNIGDNIEAFAKDFIEDLEAVLLSTSHKLLFGAIMKAFDGFAVITLIDDTDENRDNQKD